MVELILEFADDSNDDTDECNNVGYNTYSGKISPTLDPSTRLT